MPEAARLKSVSNVWKSLARDFAIALRHLFFSFKFLQHHFGVYLYISMPLTLVMFLAILVGGLEHDWENMVKKPTNSMTLSASCLPNPQ